MPVVFPFLKQHKHNEARAHSALLRSCLLVRGTLLALGLLIHSLPAWTFGLGTPARQPVIGSLLRIEIPLILGQGEEPPSKDCLRIVPIAGSQDKQFFPRDTQLFLEMGGIPKVIVVSQRPVSEPIIEFNLIVGCNEQFAREVLLLADPPQSPTLPRTSRQAVAEAPLAPIDARPMRAPLLTSKVEATVDLTLPTDTTLNALARKRYPTQRATRDEYRRQMIAANPGFFVDSQLPGAILLPKGTILKVPATLPPVETPPLKGATDQASAPGAPRASLKTKDRLVIGGGGGGVNERKFVASGEALAAIERLELMIAEQRVIESRIEESLLVMNQSLIDTRHRFTELQVAQVRDSKEKNELRKRPDKVDANLEGAIGFWQFFILILSSGGIGAGLLVLHASLTNAKRTPTEPITPPPSELAAETAQTPTPTTAPAPARRQIVPGIAARGASAPLDPRPPADSLRLPWETETNGPTATGRSMTAQAPEPVPARATTNSVKSPARNAKVPSAKPPAILTDDSHRTDFEMPEIDFGRLPREKNNEVPAAAAQSIASPAHAPRPANAKKPLKSSAGSSDAASSTLPRTSSDDSPQIDFEVPMIDVAGLPGKKPAAKSAAAPAPDVEHLSLITPAVMLNPELAADELRHTPHAAKLFFGQATIAIGQSIGLTGGLATRINQLLPRLPSFDIDAWFEAFDTLRAAGERKAFASLTGLLGENLNVEPPFWEPDRRAVKSSILDHTNVMRRLQALWQADDPELARALLLELLADSRGGTRAGFSEGSAKDIYMLIRVLDEFSSKD